MRISTLPIPKLGSIPFSPSTDATWRDTVDAQKLLLFDFNSQKWSELARASIG